MQKYLNSVADGTGRPVVGASVEVLDYPSGASAVIYSDNGVTLAANPLTTDANGAFSFYAADGRYSLSITGTSITPQVITDILLEDVTDGGSSPTFATITVTGTSNSIGYKQGSTGSVPRTVEAKLQESVSVLDFGADPTGVADSTAAIQAAINFAQTYGKKVFVPTGTYLCGALSVTSNPGITIEGEQSDAYPVGQSGAGVRFIYTGTGDFLSVNVGSSSSTFTYRCFFSNFTVFFQQATANSGIRLHNVQESIFRNVSIQGNSSQTIASAFYLDSAGIVEFDSCIASYVQDVFNCTGESGGQITGSMNITNGNFYRVTNVFTGGSDFYCINFKGNWCEGFQNAFFFDTAQSYNGIDIANLNLDGNTFLQSTAGLTQTRVLKVTSTTNTLPVNFYVNMRGNFVDMAGSGATQPDYAIEFALSSNTATVDGLFNCENNLFWNVLAEALTTDTNAIRLLESGNDTRLGIYGSGRIPFVIPGTTCGFAKRTLAAEYADFSAANSTTEVVLKTIYVPTDHLVLGRSLVLDMLCTYINSANAKTINVRLGGLTGTLLASFANTAINDAEMSLKMGVLTSGGNIRVAATQWTNPAAGSVPLQYGAYAVPTGALQEVTITGYVANASDNVVLNMYKLSLE